MAAVERCVAWLSGRRGAVIALAALWIMVIAASAGQPADGDAWVGLPTAEWLGFIFAGAVVISVIVLLLAVATSGGRGDRRQGRRPPFLAILILILILLALGQRNADQLPGETTEPEASNTTEELPGEINSPSSPLGQSELVVLLVMLGTAAAVLLWSHGRRPEDAEVALPGEELEKMLGPAVEQAGQHLLTATDPRSAVLLAYATLEGALTDAGHAPADHETPGEHLRRVLRHRSIDAEPLFQLADLYQLARFSNHAITPAQQQDAAAALDLVRKQLVPMQ